MKFKNKFLSIYLILVAVVTIIGLARDNNLFNNSLFNIWMSVTANVIGWYLILKIIFWLYDFIKKRSNKWKPDKEKIYFLAIVILVIITALTGYFIKANLSSKKSSQSGKLSEVKDSEVNSKELEEYYQTYNV